MPEAAEKPAPPKAPPRSWILFALVGLVAAGAGMAVPIFFFGTRPATTETPHAAVKDDKLAIVPFDPVSVNLATERLTRYVRVKLVLVVEESKKNEITELAKKKQSFLKNWLISYLADQTLEEIKGTAGVNRLRREILDQFNALLSTDEHELVRDVLFEEFLIQ